MSKQDVVSYMVNRQWTVDQKAERKRYLYRLAQQSKFDRDIASKIGGMLIYNQVIEQFLIDITRMSIYFIKAEVWPVVVDLDVDIEKATFGKVIEYFTRYSTIEPNRDQLLAYLKKFNSKRNLVVHDLFDIQDLNKLGQELDEYAKLADEILILLVEYEDHVCENFCALSKRVNFQKYQET